jgi:hypothetical protein
MLEALILQYDEKFTNKNWVTLDAYLKEPEKYPEEAIYIGPRQRLDDDKWIIPQIFGFSGTIYFWPSNFIVIEDSGEFTDLRDQSGGKWGLRPYKLEKAVVVEEWNIPDWNGGGKVHNWRNYISEELREMWSTFSLKQKEALFNNAKDVANGEEWD